MTDGPLYIWTCTAQTWSLTLPSFTWLTVLNVLLYAVALVLSARLTISTSRRVTGDFWFGLSALLVFLFLIEQMDLRSAATAMLTCHAVQYDWINNHAFVHRTLMTALVVITAILITSLIVTMRRRIKSHGSAIAGLACLILFCAVGLAQIISLNPGEGQEMRRVSPSLSTLQFLGLVLIISNAARLELKIWRSRKERNTL